jgi:predicted transcriptional regulator
MTDPTVPTGAVTQYSYDRLGRTTTTIQNYLDGSDAAGERTA